MADKERFLRELRRGLRREGVVPPRRSAIVADVEASIDEAAGDAGEAEVIRAMGDPAEVAREYAAVERDHPVRVVRWGRGLICAGAVLAALIIVQGVHIPTFGVIEYMSPEYGGSYWEVSLWPLFRLWGDTNAGYVADAAVGVLSYLLFPLVAFLLGSCIWRVRPLKAPDAAP